MGRGHFAGAALLVFGMVTLFFLVFEWSGWQRAVEAYQPSSFNVLLIGSFVPVSILGISLTPVWSLYVVKKGKNALVL